jgi:multiple sugar transport system permease protein
MVVHGAAVGAFHERARTAIGRLARPTGRAALVYGGIGVAVLFFLFPIYWMVVTALKPPSEWLTYPPIFFPRYIHWSNFSQALTAYHGAKGLADSAVLTTTTTVLGLVFGVPAAYAMARFRPGGRHLSFFILSVLFLPPFSVALPMFIFWAHLGLVDTYFSLIAQDLTFTVPFVTWLMKGFIEDLPISLEESALVNGASRLRALWDVVIPNVRPGLVATSLFSLIFVWNEFTYAVILTRTRVSPLPVILPSLMESHYILWGDIAAMATVAAVPVVAICFFLQRYLVRGLSFGAIRGGTQ